MSTALYAASLSLKNELEKAFSEEPDLASDFDPGTFEISLNTPQEMIDLNLKGLSIWLYRLVPDEIRLNAPRIRSDDTRLENRPLPMRLHYLMTPIVNVTAPNNGPEKEQRILGKVLQTFNDKPILRGSDLQNSFVGTDVQLNLRLEPMSLEEITRVWDALGSSYQFCLSYEVTVIV
jgi:Pvc16 N-terminal domain